jgi:hypothetical protein
MKKISLIAAFALFCNFAMAQIQATAFRGAFAPAPTAMWTQGWTNFDPNNAVYGAVTVPVTADITTNTTWRKNQVYELTRLITVRNNATLTIEAGTVIRSNALASALVITRGAKLNANGTATEPIIFTSKNDAGSRARGNWGGIVILGKAKFNINGGVQFIEGISQNTNTEFGGGLTPDDNDNSGVLRYVRIEFAGFVFSPNNELNGLTMGAVGRGTTIDHVQVSYSNDDSFEWFGGSVNCKYLVAFAGLDDDFDVDNGYKGIVQYGLSIKDPIAADISTSEAFEVDNNAAGTVTAVSWGDTTSPIFSNITCVGPIERQALPNGGTLNSFHDKSLRIRRASAPRIFNSIFVGHAKGLVFNDLLTAANIPTNTLKFKNNLIASALPLQSTSGITTTTSPSISDIATWFATPAHDNKTYANSTGLLNRTYNAANGQNYNMIVDNNDTVNCDLRPLSVDARTGASFTDAAFDNLIAIGTAPRVNPLTYCKGEVASALTAQLTATGVSLRWYTTLTATTFTTVAPVPTTSVVGNRSFFVSEVDSDGIESAKAAIVVTVNDSPAALVGTIIPTFTADGAAATAAVGPQIGTDTSFTYTIANDTNVASYFWTVPAGAIFTQNRNSIAVTYPNVASGLFSVGNISVQAVNATGCKGPVKNLAITAALPIAPSRIAMIDPAMPNNAITNLPVAITSFGRYMGSTTPLTLTATAVPTARTNGYVWELPAGVNILSLGTQVDANGPLPGLDLVVFFNSYPFSVPSFTRPTGAGNVYYEITTKDYMTAGATLASKVVTGRIIQNARVATGNLPAIAASNRELTNMTNEGVRVYPAFPTTYSFNEITVNFAGVSASNTFPYTGTTGIPTNSMRIGVIAGNRVGASVTNNAALLNPVTASTARLLTLIATRPASPASIRMTDAAAVDPMKAVTIVSNFIGTTKVFTLTAAPSPLASSYTWTLPAGVNALSSLTSNVITVNFAGVASGTTALFIGCNAVNGIGSSVAVNVAPNEASTARLLRLTAAVPAAIASVTGQIAGVCGGTSYNYTITPSLLATSYMITAPTGSVVTSANNVMNTSNVLSTSDLTFTVMYPSNFVATVAAPKSIVIASVNGVGNSLTNRTVVLSTLLPALGTVTSTTGNITQFNQALTAKVFSVTTNVLFTGYTWTVSNGAVITGGQGTNTITVDFSGVIGTLSTTSSTITVVGTNACNSSAAKSTTLRYNVAAARNASDALTVSTTEVYPNPVSSVFNVDVTASNAGVLEIAIYSLDGTMIVSPKSVDLEKGANTITENVSSLNSGIYIVRLVNATNSEVITRKLIKN